MRSMLLPCAVAVLLAACGGRSETPMPPRAATESAPVATSQTSVSRVTYRAGPSAASTEDQEPTDVSMLKLSQPEDTEPEPVK
jgi:hypothetical protein